MSCTLSGCTSPGTPTFQNFCSKSHLQQFAWRQVLPDITRTQKGDRVYFYDKNKHANNYEFSNFFPKSVQYHGVKYKTAEHAYQAEKFNYHPHDAILAAKVNKVYHKICRADTPKEAALLAGKYAKYVDRNWHKTGGSGYSKKDSVMFDIVKDKFTRHPNLKTKLLQTGRARLVEDSSVDSYWGRGANGQGENKLGCMLQKVRSGIQSGKY